MGLLDWFRGVSPESAAKALTLMDEGKYYEAADRLRNASEAEHLAMLAECLFQTGRAAEALAAARRALPKADAELGLTLWGTVYEACRYLGDGAGAAAACDELAKKDPRYGRQAALVWAGEPLLRVVADVGGRRCEVEEVLEGVAGPVRWMFERNRATLRPVADAVRKGEAATASADFDLEEDMLPVRAAADVDPFDPAPRYLLGMVYAHQGDWAQAGERLAEAERLAPGWFLVRSALALIGREDVVLFREWHAVAEGPLPDAMKIEIITRAVERCPDCAHLHHLHGKMLRARNQGMAAERAYRAALALTPPPDLLTRVCADLAAVTADAGERVDLLRRAVETGADLPAAATARVVLAFDGGAS